MGVCNNISVLGSNNNIEDKIMKQKLLYYLLGCFLLVTNYASAALPPVAQFSANVYSGCAPLTVSFFNSSSGAGVYSWNFDDPISGASNTSVDCSPIHTFDDPGTYDVLLTYVLDGITYTAIETITVHPLPDATFSGDDSLCTNEVSSYTASGAGLAYKWSAQGGSIVGPDNNPTVNVNWTVAGTGYVELTTTNAFGCSSTERMYILIVLNPELGDFCRLPRKGRPGNTSDGGVNVGDYDSTHKFTETECVCENTTLFFPALGLNGQVLNNNYYDFQWTVTGATIVNGAGTNEIELLIGTGPTFSIELIVSSPFGCSDTGYCVFDVCPGPTAIFNNSSACVGSPINFNAGASYTPPLTYAWDFGDGFTADGPSNYIFHSYDAAGTYSVTLTVENGDGCSHDTTMDVTVDPGTSPTIDCVGTVCNGQTKCYNTPYYAGATYSWTVNGGIGTPSANGDSICVLWGAGPVGTIELTVTGGPYSCNFAMVNIPVFPSTIAIYGPDTICVNSATEFGTDIIPGSCYKWSVTLPGGSIIFVDPSSNPGNTINVNLLGSGVYQINLEMTNEITCCSGTATKTVVVQGPLSLAGPNQACEETTHTYTSNVPVSLWSTNDGTIVSSTSTSVTIQWGAAGVGIITAYASDPATVCNNFAKYKVTIHPKPIASPVIGTEITCQGNTEIFNSLVETGITSVWSISPTTGIVINTSTPVLDAQFNTIGSYTVSVVYTNTFGCMTQVDHAIEVLDTAKPIISGPSSVCEGATETYTITSNPGDAWDWSVIGGEILASTTTSITIQWGNISSGQVKLQNGICGGLSYRLVTVNAIPLGEITVGPGNCAGTQVTLCGPPGYTYNWTGGPTTQCFTVTAPTASATLTISENGCSKSITKTLSPFPKLPSPNISLIQHCMPAPSTPLPIEIEAISSDDNLTYSWDPTVGTADTIKYHYTTALSTLITCIATNEYGCKDTATITTPSKCVITLPGGGGTPCNVAGTATISYNPCTGIFTPTITLGAGVSVTNYLWDFTDGFYSDDANPEHYFSALGTYYVTLNFWVTDGTCGNWKSVRTPIIVDYILRPKMSHSFPISCDYNTVQLNYAPSSIVLATGTITYTTNWDDGSSIESGSLPKNHTYSTPGVYVASHTVSYGGCTKTVTDTITILPFDADFGFCDNSCIGQTIQFYDKSNSSEPIVHYDWDFGDGNTSNLMSPFHVFNAIGTYTVQLIITNQSGCLDTQTYNITITTFNPGALSFAINTVAEPAATAFSICEGDVLTATAPSGYYYSWNTGGGTAIKDITESGVYWCIVANGSGCTDTMGPFTVIVNPNPNATIISDDSVCQNSVIDIFALQGVGYAYDWSVSPAPTSLFNETTAAPYIYFGTAGNYTVNLEVTNSFGCKATATKVVTVNPTPTVTITSSAIGWVCDGDSIQLTANITGAYTSFVWSTGATTTSIWVHSNQSISLFVTTAEGCIVEVASNVGLFTPLPDLSNIPKGCYEVCQANENIKVCGPYPIGSQVFTYDWTLNGATVGTTQNYIVSASGDCQLTVVNTTTGCSSTSDIFNVQYIGSPVAVINSPAPTITICEGSSGVVLTAGPNPFPVTYNWYLNGTWVNTGTSYTATGPGTVQLVAWFSECCADTTEVIIEGGDCCFEPSVDFTVINDGTTYTTNTVWDGKYYIAGKVYVTGNAIFDMTLVDAVFDRDGEIIFQDEAIARINNSVLRPCELDSVWEGLTFQHNSKGTVQETLFKNAVNAIYCQSDKPTSVRITDNTFSNCNTGVRIEKSAEYTEGITHNSFVIDNTNFSAQPLYGTYTYYGIHATGAKMRELISQNQFKNSAFNKQSNRYHGIYMKGASGVLSENLFTNMYRGIDMVAVNEYSKIENNEFEQTQYSKDHNFATNAQIRVTDCELPVLVFGNELRNSNKDYQFNVAIYAANCVNLNIRDNNVKGFHYGIQTYRLNRSTINENDLDNINAMGIYDNRSSSTNFNCNIIRMKISSGWGAYSYGLGVYAYGGNNSNRIYSNCIYDCKEAIRVRAAGSGIAIPQIHNNYMYNFYRVGIRNYGHTGSIGTIGNPGRNTFLSNNHGGGARDIFSTSVINQSCNQGATFNNANVNTVVGSCANGMFSSTASCGQVNVNGNKFRLNTWDNCDNYTKGFIIIQQDGKDKISVRKSSELVLKEVSNDDIHRAIYFASELNDAAAYQDWLDVMVKRGMSSADIQLAKATWEFANGDMRTAVHLISNVQFSNTIQNEQLTITKAAWNFALNGKLSSQEMAEMKSIDDARGVNASEARDVVQAAIGDHDYIFSAPSTNEDPVQANSSENNIVAYPNPTYDFATVNVNIENEAGLETELFDMHGKKILNRIDVLNQGSYKIDMRNLSQGIYFVRVKNLDDGATYTKKILKNNK